MASPVSRLKKKTMDVCENKRAHYQRDCKSSALSMSRSTSRGSSQEAWIEGRIGRGLALAQSSNIELDVLESWLQSSLTQKCIYCTFV